MMTKSSEERNRRMYGASMLWLWDWGGGGGDQTIEKTKTKHWMRWFWKCTTHTHTQADSQREREGLLIRHNKYSSQELHLLSVANYPTIWDDTLAIYSHHKQQKDCWVQGTCVSLTGRVIPFIKRSASDIIQSLIVNKNLFSCTRYANSLACISPTDWKYKSAHVKSQTFTLMDFSPSD